VRSQSESLIDRAYAHLITVARDGGLDARAVEDVQELLCDPVFARLPRKRGNPLQSYLHMVRQAIVALEMVSQGRVEEAVRLSSCALLGVRDERSRACDCDSSESAVVEGFHEALAAMRTRLRQGTGDGETPALEPVAMRDADSR
jgi:hypothetical protein